MTSIGLIGLSVYGGTAYAVDIDDAHRVVALMERDRILLNRHCGPNQATIPVKSWHALPSEITRANVLRTLARLCLEVNRGDQMELLDEAGGRLAVFDGALYRAVARAREVRAARDSAAACVATSLAVPGHSGRCCIPQLRRFPRPDVAPRLIEEFGRDYALPVSGGGPADRERISICCGLRQKQREKAGEFCGLRGRSERTSS